MIVTTESKPLVTVLVEVLQTQNKRRNWIITAESKAATFLDSVQILADTACPNLSQTSRQELQMVEEKKEKLK